MNSHFVTAPFLLCFHLLSFAFIWFKVQGSGFRSEVAASPPFFRRWYSRITAFPSREGAPQGRIGGLWHERLLG